MHTTFTQHPRTQILGWRIDEVASVTNGAGHREGFINVGAPLHRQHRPFLVLWGLVAVKRVARETPAQARRGLPASVRDRACAAKGRQTVAPGGQGRSDACCHPNVAQVLDCLYVFNRGGCLASECGGMGIGLHQLLGFLCRCTSITETKTTLSRLVSRERGARVLGRLVPNLVQPGSPTGRLALQPRRKRCFCHHMHLDALAIALYIYIRERHAFEKPAAGSNATDGASQEAGSTQGSSSGRHPPAPLRSEGPAHHQAVHLFIAGALSMRRF